LGRGPLILENATQGGILYWHLVVGWACFHDRAGSGIPMNCEQCGASNPEGQKYCGACGAPLDSLAGPTRAAVESTVRQEVAKALSGYVKDQRIAEFDITEKVANRLIGWGKVVGVFLGIFVAGAGYLGFKSVKDVVDGLKTELQPLAENAKKSAIELQKQITYAKSEVESLNNESAQLKTNFAQMELEAGPIHERLAKLQADFNVQNSVVDELKTRVSQLDTRFRELPKPSGAPPYHLRFEDVIGGGKPGWNVPDTGSLVFQATGDTGGIQDPVPQERVAKAMRAQFDAPNAIQKPAFLYLLGDLIYYNGELKEYYNQFYRPYANYPAPIFAIPGNHDGDNLQAESSLAAFMANFGAPAPVHTLEAGGSNRMAMTQPNSYWTLQTRRATIIGLYTNVPEGGVIDDRQQDWLVHELESAPLDRALILTLHHPPFSVDTFARSARMSSVIEDAFNKARRVPNLVLSGHVNNYQRIDVELRSRLVVPFFIIGTGGYHNLRKFPRAAAASSKPRANPKAGKATLRAGFDDRYGFVTFEISGSEIKGRFMSLGKDASDTASPADEFTYSATPIVLGDGQTVSSD
jgi:acid phosphatase type 7